jgi:nucleotidyltransferase/DNA polymerase involved in DNA repair
MKRIKAIREHRLVGNGSCTSIDECWTDDEIIECLDNLGVESPEGAVKWALEQEGMWREQGLNASSGEQDCPLVESYRQWKEDVKDS